LKSIDSKIFKSNNLNIFLLWLGLVIITYFSRYYFPLDETRYVTVAWNMWLRHDFLVPYLNGEAYSHKPPLLFWLINVGWAIFGINDWWPRLVPSFFALAAVFLTQLIARRLWPQHGKVAYLSPVILLGSALWTVFTTAIMFDIILAFFTLLGVLGLLIAWQDSKKIRGWLIFALAIAGGLLIKGHAILLQLIPLAILAPWWMTHSRPNWRHWYIGLLCAVLLGVAILLAWAIPAGIAGGAKYQHDIFWGQTADRMVKSFAHRHPIWWYLQMLPIMIFPWLFGLPLWRATLRVPSLLNEAGVRLCLAWLLPVFVAFSFISGKQLHYLLPIFPAFALLTARCLDGITRVTLVDRIVVMASGVLIGSALIYVASSNDFIKMADWVSNISVWSGLILIAGTSGLFLLRGNDIGRFVWSATLLSSLTTAVFFVGVIKHAGSAYDLRNISREIKKLQDQGVELSYVGKYHGQFNFIGRLTESPESVNFLQMNRWFEQHPQGRVIMLFYRDRQLGDSQTEYIQTYRGGSMGILTRNQWENWESENRKSARETSLDRKEIEE
jgi:4-amino-4-deoxy-L-arabinose transferase-like glycosyltransferase